MVSKVLVRALTISTSSPLSPRSLQASLSCHLLAVVSILLFTFFFFLTILSHKQGRKKQNKKKEDEKEGKTRVSVGRGT